MKKIYFNREKAVELQMTAETPEEANKRFDFSCSICNNAAWCNEAKCKVLTKALKNITLRRQALAIDAASVYLEMNDYANAEIVLRKNGLETEANAVGRLK